MTEQLALTSSQTGVWVAQQLDPDDKSFTSSEYCDIAGPIDPVLFETALREVVATTPALRARFDIGDEGLTQYIDDTVDIPMHYLDVSGEPDPCAAARRWMARHREEEVYDLAKGPLVTWALFKASPERFLWYRAVHHIVVDGFGCALIASHVADVYTALATGRPRRPRPPGTLQQAVEADTAYQLSEAFNRDGEFWRAHLADQTETVSLTDWRPPAQRRVDPGGRLSRACGRRCAAVRGAPPRPPLAGSRHRGGCCATAPGKRRAKHGSWPAGDRPF
ncbi:hypothetical protein Srufu_019860 [Streptomyces libani subsp. rufus]|nr:hypothetical protein Srufu_019860 [Streptomyces libani subsp. rufus]